MPKQTRLDEQAQIYQPRKQQTEKEKLSGMNFKDKLAYLWEYYKIHLFVAIAVIALIVYFVNQFINPPVKPQFYAAILNSELSPTVTEQYQTDFAQYLQLNPKRESVELNTSLFISNDNAFTSTSQQVLSTYIAAGEVDVIIAPESLFKEFVTNEYFAKLSDELPTDIYSSLTDSFLISDTKDDTEKNAYGIILTNTELFKGATYNSEPYILGILANHPHEDNTVEFIKYIIQK